MYKKINVKELNENELKRLTAFMMDNQDKGNPTIYYTTNDCIGMGFRIIATYNKPKQVNMYGKIDFGECIDLTDYDYRINQM